MLRDRREWEVAAFWHDHRDAKPSGLYRKWWLLPLQLLLRLGLESGLVLIPGVNFLDRKEPQLAKLKNLPQSAGATSVLEYHGAV